jgi:hypothetical protein
VIKINFRIITCKIAKSGLASKIFDYFKIHKLELGTAHSKVLTTHFGIDAHLDVTADYAQFIL